MRRIGLRLTVTILIFSILCLLPGCFSTGQPAQDIGGAFASALSTVAKSTLEKLNIQVELLDGQLTEIETKLNKLEQVAQPALEWIEQTKTRASSENWGGNKVARATGELEKLQNDQYRVMQLELHTTLGTSGILFESVIIVDDLQTGKLMPYEELRDDLQLEIKNLNDQMTWLLEDWDMVKMVNTGLLDKSGSWEIVQVNDTTYNVSGEGLGWHSGLIRGEWMYKTDTGIATPANSPAQELQKVLRGQ